MDECLENYVRENFRLKKQLAELKETLESIRGKIICIGGPLNDNIRKYNKEQLMIFFYIKSEIDSVT